ncbi:MAG: AMP-binding protein [Oscillospiraceae bacterium]|nr:AMP-binding protein [Oscillospiraceae bacterium]
MKATKENMSNIATPWLKNYGDVPFNLDYPEGSMSDRVLEIAETYPKQTALSFMGKDISYSKLREMIEVTAKAFIAIGVRAGDRVTVCLPNVPQAIYCLYALNRIGAIASMIHPLSAEGEIVFYLNEVNSDCVITLNQFYDKFVEVQKERPIKKLIICGVVEELKPLMAVGFALTQGRSLPKIPNKPNIIRWPDFVARGRSARLSDYAVKRKPEDPAVILFSGGTTGVTKGIVLSNLNFNALAMQTAAMAHAPVVGSKMLAAMPIFHGFGLGVCIHTMLAVGGQSILVPRFDVKSYAGLIKKNRPNYIAGVPTLYEALTRTDYLDGVVLDCLLGVFSGGDSLSIELKKKIDKYLDEHGSPIHVREGYGTTECVTASCLTPYNQEREGSIGLPYPDTYYKICEPGTVEELPYGKEGEICLTGPTVMLEYLNHPVETAGTLVRHTDGHIWLHTGDLGLMDADGFIYFKQRLKRMIVTSGYNVYPSQLENIFDAHEFVQMSCVIGVPDPYKIQKTKAYVVLKAGVPANDETREALFDYCRKNIAKYAIPYEIEFREALPKTLVGKVAYTVLEAETAEKEKLADEEKAPATV